MEVLDQIIFLSFHGCFVGSMLIFQGVVLPCYCPTAGIGTMALPGDGYRDPTTSGAGNKPSRCRMLFLSGEGFNLSNEIPRPKRLWFFR